MKFKKKFKNNKWKRTKFLVENKLNKAQEIHKKKLLFDVARLLTSPCCLISTPFIHTKDKETKSDILLTQHQTNASPSPKLPKCHIRMK